MQEVARLYDEALAADSEPQARPDVGLHPHEDIRNGSPSLKTGEGLPVHQCNSDLIIQ